MFMDWTITTLVTSVLFVFIAGTIRGFAGFGAALAMVPPLSGVFGPTKAIALVAIIESIGMIQLLPNAIKQADWQYVKPLILTALLSVPIGVSLLVIINPDVIKIIMSMIVLIFILAMGLGWQRAAQFNLGPVLGVGILSGFLAGITGMAGPPVILYLLSPKGMVPDGVRASLIIFFGITGIVTMTSIFLMSNIEFSTLIDSILILVPVFMLATYFGTKLFNKSKNKSYRNVALILLGLISTISLYSMYG